MSANEQWGHNLPEYSVSQISQSVRRTLEDQFGYVKIRGEISGLVRAGSGHVYLSLKDEGAVLAAVCWRGVADKFPFKPEDGLEVVCTGKVTAYAGQSKYQLVVDYMEPAGLGSLMAMLEKRKQMFEKEGLFDAGRKRRLPFLPSHIGIVTSPTGAVIQDMLHRIEDRFPSYIQLWPVKVQGEGAAEEIAAAIAGFNAMDNPPDVLIVARGGGSIEDLWAFNEEIVVRAASGSHIPLVSAVGHETDTTLIDYAADVRAPTPTAAAEFVVPVKQEIEAGLYESYSRLKLSLERYLSERGTALKHAFERLPTPEYWLMEKRQRADQYEWRLLTAIRQRVVELDKRLTAAAANITHPKHTVSINQERLGHVWERLQRVVKQRLSDREQRVALYTKLLESYSYTNTLQRGFSLVRNGEGKLVASGADIHSGDKVAIEFFDAAYDATIEGKIDE